MGSCWYETKKKDAKENCPNFALKHMTYTDYLSSFSKPTLNIVSGQALCRAMSEISKGLPAVQADRITHVRTPQNKETG